ncbi:hypothetical protein RIF29_39250 [Crotalaria pallida]|uniref:Uncharacterized protein n=1 Tax=Crotalaria pallida TaxID=3830 RepID=A0AAN9E0S2_CROPI
MRWFPKQDDDVDSDSSDNRQVDSLVKMHILPLHSSSPRNSNMKEDPTTCITMSLEKAVSALFFACQERTTSNIGTIKKIKFGHSKDSFPAYVIKEISILQLLQHHPSIARLQKVLPDETHVDILLEPFAFDLGLSIIDNNGIKNPYIRKLEDGNFFDNVSWNAVFTVTKFDRLDSASVACGSFLARENRAETAFSKLIVIQESESTSSSCFGNRRIVKWKEARIGATCILFLLDLNP